MLDRLMSDLKDAMKNKNKNVKDIVKAIVSKAKGYAKEKLREVNDEDIIRAIKSELKQTQDALSQMKDNFSEEQIKDYEGRINIIKAYLPKQYSEDEIKTFVDVLFSETGLEKNIKAMGTAMKAMKEKLRNKADSALLSKTIKNYINQ